MSTLTVRNIEPVIKDKLRLMAAAHGHSMEDAELLFGVARLPEGARKQQLTLAVSAMLEQDFAGQILSFDLSAASVYAVLLADLERIGQNMAMADAQIAAICLSRDAKLATRNTSHFEGLGLALMNPWDSHSSSTVS